MPRHDDQLVSFEVPRDWDNRSIVAYAAPPADDEMGAANLVMTRDKLGDGEDLGDYVDQHLAALEDSLSGFSLLDDQQVEVDGRPAISLTFCSDGDEGILLQRLTMVLLPERMVASFTMTVPQKDAAQVAPLFERILSSVRVQEPKQP